MRERGRTKAWDRKSRYQTWDGRTALDREAARLQGRSSYTRRSDTGGYVGHRRQQKTMGDWGYDKGVYRQATAFFFTNFPEEWSYTDMWSTFRRFGRVIAIYSPLKRNKSGSRFGFVRFLDVKNEKELERQLDQIRIEGRKIWVNVAKYPEEKVAVKEINKTAPIVNTIQNRSYAEVAGGHVGVKERKTEGIQIPPQLRDVQRNHRKSEGNGQPVRRQTWRVKSRREEWSGFEYEVKDEDFEWLQGCYVGIAHSVEIVPNLQEKFYMEGYFTCRLRAMGGKLVLMDCEDKGELVDLVQGASDWLGQWFSEVKPWSPKEVAKERFAWLRCQGAPLHAWGPDFFERMSSAWGKFICLDDSTSNKRRFDIARFLISTPIMDSISVRRQIKVNGELFSLKFSEEEWSNSLFSLKQDFIPRFASDSEIEEHWSEKVRLKGGCKLSLESHRGVRQFFLGCEELVEIQGRFKLEPLSSNQLDKLERLFGLKALQNKRLDFYNDFTKTLSKARPIQGFSDFMDRVYSIFLPGGVIPNFFNHKNNGVSIAVDVSQVSSGIFQGLAVYVVYYSGKAFDSGFPLLCLKMEDINSSGCFYYYKYTPQFIGYHDIDEVMWVSYWRAPSLVNKCKIFRIEVENEGSHPLMLKRIGFRLLSEEELDLVPLLSGKSLTSTVHTPLKL
ncbi:hypothetical protein SLEP1_g57866 [Rubroshorea leprosula]|uniref:RRM domain-containing protein n=1 Tax=Rubroshorea leprosula TaxID=152421 RepID=A0AAV5MNS0_9ROSI|nr:hypothetical protein SLEP1_g57866 [Rubroshorea leprosula]